MDSTALRKSFMGGYNKKSVHALLDYLADEKEKELSSLGEENGKLRDRIAELEKENEELSAMIKDFQAKQLEIQTKTMMGQQMGPEDMASVQQFYAIMAKDPLAAQYLQAEMRFSLMMKDVYEIIGEAIGAGSLLG